jgi:hypothetical protein
VLVKKTWRTLISKSVCAQLNLIELATFLNWQPREIFHLLPPPQPRIDRFDCFHHCPWPWTRRQVEVPRLLRLTPYTTQKVYGRVPNVPSCKCGLPGNQLSNVNSNTLSGHDHAWFSLEAPIRIPEWSTENRMEWLKAIPKIKFSLRRRAYIPWVRV